MKRVKRLSIVLLTIILTIASIQGISANVSEEAVICETIGMLRGSAEGVTPQYLQSNALRYQATVLFLRLKGLEEDMLSFDYEGKATFKDVDGTSEYIQRLLAYLKANPELGWQGYTDGTFKPFNTITIKEYKKVMLEALGYKQDMDFTWDQVNVFANVKGITESKSDEFTVDNLCIVTVQTLKAIMKEGTTLIEDLISKEVIRTIDAALVGLVEQPLELEVESLTMDNLAEVMVIFNKAIESTNVDSSDFTLFVNNIEKPIIRVEVEGGIVILLVEDNAINQQDNIKVIVRKSMGIDRDKEKTLTNVMDVKPPEVISIITSGTNQFKVIFSEPLSKRPNIQVNNNGIATSIVDFSSGDKEVIIQATSPLNDGTEYSIKVSDVQDFNDYIMDEYTSIVTYKVDKSLLTVKVLSVTEKEIQIKFSEEVTGVSTSDFWHSYKTYRPDEVIPNTSSSGYDDEYTLVFNHHFIGYSDTTFTVLKDNITDKWGNQLEDDLSFTIKSVMDTDSPIVLVVEAKETYITLEFSEPIKNLAISNLKLTSLDERIIPITGISTILDKNQYIISYAPMSGNYKLTIMDVFDKAFINNIIYPNPTQLNIGIADTLAPNLSGLKAEVSEHVAIVTFTEAMNNTVIDKDKWRGVIGSNEYKPTQVEFIGANNNEVKLIFDDSIVPSTFDKLIIGQVADYSGNQVSALSTDIGVVAASDAQILQVTTLSKNELSIKIEGRVIEGISTDNILIVDSDGLTTCLAATVSTRYIDEGKNTLLTVKTQTPVTFAANEVPSEISVVNMITDKGFNVTTDSFTISDGIVDGINPTYVSSTNTGDDLDGVTTGIALIFNEPLASYYTLSVAHELVIEADNKILSPVIDYTTRLHSSKANIIVIEFNEHYSHVIVNIMESPQYIQDIAGNTFKGIDNILQFDY